MGEDDAMTATVRPMRERDLASVLLWRNALEVRRYMYNQDEIGLDQHRHWFAGVEADSKRHALIAETADGPIGFVNIAELHQGVASWGFYAVPGSPRGAGVALGAAALHHAFDILRLHKLCGEALADNLRSVRFHERLGFHDEGTLRSHRLVAGVYRDVRCFGLLAEEWRAASR
ncbi:UDP-4-amino-4,6-dideoxy-N-acetyl-beta-L-altrosamine N-acetyltransferase [Sphingomonas leidyi]|jgi:UDP-4-amino-4,6-dideoxy-N-acetyl-beta-L-altrosamine N-acetyltransferase|uniref:UDP-4-amino-4, 6-dideoxy-N-acetyl-beta-L-altrosamine N-acetyltransferase n=1 Tax=Sphingomonas leidyi TaxID=68569 RepID=A0A7X5ZUQ2_9SPHN|nr:UDP-4-amino-4,6-dideoxy-N-acetyl-beta-L-altrosamine N-acetyltransferase [Sphingomonas leidyi]NIJ63643.1 UDP-4-amino-4,6-dideoxy-N-acetyl-beta-L-altrosamine N-acetyltransferase [Sphingomonas leidyi]